MLDRETVKGPGAPEGNQNAAEEKTNHNNVMICIDESEPAQGNASTYALRRLRKERPDLHEQVLADMLSPHAAMIPRYQACPRRHARTRQATEQ